MSCTNLKNHRKRGIAYILAIIFLMVFISLGVAYAAVINSNVRQADNLASVQTARIQAEGGLGFILDQLRTVRVPPFDSEGELLTNLSVELGKYLNGSPNLDGQTVAVIGSEVVVPEISLDGRTFSCHISPTASGNYQVKVKGTSQGVSRWVSIEVQLAEKLGTAFDYGIASRGQIMIGGNAKIIGVNDAIEASVCSTSKLFDDAIYVTDDAVISGDLSVSGDNSYIDITGIPSIAGSTDPAEYADNIHLGVREPSFPEPDTSYLSTLADGDLITKKTDTGGGGLVFNNARIAAGTNPTFSSDVAFNGIVYIEAPNVVKFSSKVTVTGFFVTEQSEEPLNRCELRFRGQVDAYGVENLPDTEEFASVRQETGTFILAPGFGVVFAGGFGTINGLIAADQLTFSGTSGGLVKGTVIGLKDYTSTISGNVRIELDRSDCGDLPAGIVESYGFNTIPSSYRELIGG